MKSSNNQNLKTTPQFASEINGAEEKHKAGNDQDSDFEVIIFKIEQPALFPMAPPTRFVPKVKQHI